MNVLPHGLDFGGAVDPVKEDGRYHQLARHPEVPEEEMEVWDRGDAPVHDPDEKIPNVIDRLLEERDPHPSFVERYTFDAPEKIWAHLHIYRTTDERVWGEITGKIRDTFLGVRREGKQVVDRAREINLHKLI
jgi:hypothetical protein